MLVVFIFVFLFLLYNNYIILSEHEVIVIIGNFIWVFLFSKMIVESIYVLLDDKGELIKKIFVWYLKKKETMFLKLISYYKNQSYYKNKVISYNKYYYYNFINIFIYVYNINKNIKIDYNFNSNILLKGVSIKMDFIEDKLNNLLNNYKNNKNVINLFIKKN